MTNIKIGVDFERISIAAMVASMPLGKGTPAHGGYR
jgi:hypothetical protein